MAITHVNTTSQTAGNGTSLVVAKPGGTASGDLLLAFFTSNSQNCTPPSGFTEIADEVTEVFRSQVFYKVAGGSEPANYTFSVAAAAPLIVSLMCLRGVDTSDPIDIDPEVETSLTHSEPYTTPSVSGGSGGVLVYHRTVRVSGTTPATFTGAAGATERTDAGVFSGGSVCYSQGTYVANSEYSGSGSKSGLAITSSQSESHNIVLTLGVKSSGIPGTMTATIPAIPSMSFSGSVAYPAVVDVDLPMPTMSFDVFNGEYEGPLDVQVPISTGIEGYTDVRGTVDTEIPVPVDFLGETRRFAENVVTPDREERWLIITQDGYRLGIRNVTHLPLVVELPLIQVHFAGFTSAPGPTAEVQAEVFAPTVNAPGAAGVATASVEASDAAVVFGIAVPAETVDVSVSVDGDSAVHVTAAAGGVDVSAVAESANQARGDADDASAAVSTNDATVSRGTRALAGHVSVTCHN